MSRTAPVADGEFELAGEGSGRGHELDPVEAVRAEDVEEEGAGVAHVGGGRHEGGEQGGGQLGHLGRRGGGGHEVGAGDQGVAVAVVPVGVGVDHGADPLRRRGHRP